MSTAGILELGLSRTSGTAASPYPEIEQEIGSPTIDADLRYLARQLFVAAPRRRIFFAASGDEVDVSELCTRLATELAWLCREKVALVDTAIDGPIPVGAKNQLWRNSTDSGQWPGGGDGVCRIPAYIIEQHFEQRSPAGELDLPFAHVLFAGTITDGEAPLFCRASEGSVLVVAAHRTHRQAALRAKEILRIWNAQLLGVILSNRTFPVPECIYRRL